MYFFISPYVFLSYIIYFCQKDVLVQVTILHTYFINPFMARASDDLCF